MKKYIYGVRNGVHIIDLQKTQENLEKASEFIRSLSMNGRKILLVCTKPQATQLIIDAANETNMYYVVNKWVGGLLTNFFTMKKRIRYFKSINFFVSILSTSIEKSNIPIIINIACIKNKTGKKDIENLETVIAITTVHPKINPT